MTDPEVTPTGPAGGDGPTPRLRPRLGGPRDEGLELVDGVEAKAVIATGTPASSVCFRPPSAPTQRLLDWLARGCVESSPT